MFVTWVASSIKRHAGDQAQAGRDQRHPRRGERAERDQQDDHRCDHADRGGRADVEALRVLDHLTARGDLQAGHVHRLHLVEQRLAGAVRQQVRGLVVVDGRERRHPILRDLDRSGGLYGLTTPVTCGNEAARVSSGMIAARTAGESIVPCET